MTQGLIEWITKGRSTFGNGGVTEEIFGIEVKDPWRALEQVEEGETKEFVTKQNELSHPILHGHPAREHLEATVEQCYAYARASCPMLQGDGYYYWMFNEGTWPREVMVRSKDLNHFGKTPGKDGPEIFFDLTKEKNMSLYAYGWSPSGKYWTAVLQASGSDWQTIRTIDTHTKKAIEPDLGHSKFTFGACYIGDQGFLYKGAMYRPDEGHLEEPDGHFALFFHCLGTSQAQDVVIWRGTGVGGEDRFFGMPHVCSSDKREGSGKRSWLMLDVYHDVSPKSETWMVELPKNITSDIGQELARLVKEECRWTSRGYTGMTTYAGTLSDDTHLFLSTSDGCLQGRILAADVAEWDSSKPEDLISLREIVAEDSELHQLHSAHLIADSVLVLVYLRHACAAVVFVDARTGRPLGSTDAAGTHGDVVIDLAVEVPVPDGELTEHKCVNGEVVIPKHGSISAVSSRSDASDFYFAVETFVAPLYVLSGRLVKTKFGSEIDVSALGADAWSSPARRGDLVCDQVFYPSFDGTKIPLFICHPADLDMSKPHPTPVHAYGGFAEPMVPHFDPLFVSFMRNLRGVVAIACIRGGGEYGALWHEAATGPLRHVGFEDFAFAARYLQTKGITEPRLTASYGISNGGLLVSACMNRHPELFGAVFPDVAPTDLVRYHKFTLGRLWMAEYGSPEEPESLPYLHTNSPLHNVDHHPSVVYPAVLITTGDHDTRVVPSHSLKFLAELQTAKATNKNIFLGRIYENAGHEAGSKPVAQKVEEAVDRLVFTLLSMKPSAEYSV